MGIPIMNMEHPVIVFLVALQPVKGYLGNFAAQFAAALADVIALVQTGVEPPGRVTLGKGGDGSGVQICLAELHKQTIGRVQILEVTGDALRTQVCCGAAVTDNTGVDAVLTGDQRCSGGQAGGIGAVVFIEAHTLGGNAVDVGSGITAVAITAHVVGS